ncbi:leucine rich repeat (LRR) protein [Ruminococcaceae bacterium R-25]|nr:leucine rich repeat (LRR) protein [Ruminococcaceae bacterium R-25]SUQ11257.1 Leucine rich repeat-containing protein [Oscillospiraceae bacterium]
MTKSICRYLVLALVATLVFAVSPAKTANAFARIVAHGYFGDSGHNCEYTVYDNGLLDLRGSGGTGSFDEETTCPWEDYKTDITSVSINGNFISIGDNIFAGLCNVEEIVLPSMVQTMGNNVFAGCTNLKKVVFPSTSNFLGSGYFAANNKIETIVCEKSTYDYNRYTTFRFINRNKFIFFYSVDYEDDGNGAFRGVSRVYAGQDITFDIYPNDGYVVDKLTLSYGQGKVVEVKPDEDGKYRFHGMPDVSENDPRPVFRCTFKYNINIDTQPKDYVGQAGKTAKFSVSARGEELTYQWQLKKGKSWADLSSGGATTDTLSIKVDDSKNGKIYRCAITDKWGHTIYSDGAKITVKEPDITITKQPVSYNGLSGNTARFSVAAEGEGLSYQWQLKKGNKWADLTSGGATTSTMTIKVDYSKNGKIYRCLITNAADEYVTSEEVSITVNEPSTEIDIINQPCNANVFVGQNAVFKVIAEGEGLTYQWQLKKGSTWADLSSGGAKTDTLTIKVDLTKSGKIYRCVITDANGGQVITSEAQLLASMPVHHDVDDPVPVTPKVLPDAPAELAVEEPAAEAPAQSPVEAPAEAPAEPAPAPAAKPAPAPAAEEPAPQTDSAE